MMAMRFATISVLVFCAVAMQASGRIIVVTNTNDDGPGSLRDSLRIAQAGDTINFAVTGTITLTSDQLVVEKELFIKGPGASLLGISGNARHRVFLVQTPRNAEGFVIVSISGLTITNGAGKFGAGIENLFARLTVSECVISNNSASEGGGIASVCYHGNSGQGAADTVINNSTISGNSAQRAGGGIFNFNGGTEDSEARLVVNSSTVSGNSAHDGGGVYNLARSAPTKLRHPPGRATATINNSTISGNTATGNVGGGIYTEGNSGPHFSGISRLTINSSTISGNSARLVGGGIYNTGATVMIQNTILNRGSSGQNISRDRGTVTSLGYNLSDDDGGGFLNGAGDKINTSPLLGPLQNNGGPTFTHALLPGSPAIDAGYPRFRPPPDYDQRGCPFLREFNGRIDIGSFENQPPPHSPPCLSLGF